MNKTVIPTATQQNFTKDVDHTVGRRNDPLIEKVEMEQPGILNNSTQRTYLWRKIPEIIAANELKCHLKLQKQ